MLRLVQIVVVAVVVQSLCACGERWKPFHSPEGMFEVTMPGDPTKNVEVDPILWTKTDPS